jgi:hypothetical protein
MTYQAASAREILVSSVAKSERVNFHSKGRAVEA